jgi:hypothetical protein
MSPEYPVTKKDFFRNHLIQWIFAFTFLLHLFLWGVCFWFFWGEKELVVLRFNVYLGIDPTSISPWYTPYRIPIMATLALVIQIYLAWKFFREKDRVMAHLMLFCGGIVQIAGLIALVSVILGNR